MRGADSDKCMTKEELLKRLEKVKDEYDSGYEAEALLAYINDDDITLAWPWWSAEMAERKKMIMVKRGVDYT